MLFEAAFRNALEGFGVVAYLDKVQDLELKGDVTDMTADYKFLTPAQNTTSSRCVPTPKKGNFTNLTLVPAFIIIILFSFLQKRARPKTRCGLWSRPGLCIPLNLVDSYENRVGYACAFGATVEKCIQVLFFGEYSEIFDSDLQELQNDSTVPSWAGVFWQILAVVIIGIAYYPMFACMATDYKLLGGIIGFLYTGTWLAVSISQAVQCPEDSITFIYPGDVFALELPKYVCFTFLLLMYFWYMVERFVKFARRKKAITVDEYEEEEWKESYKYKYVMNLLQPVPKEHRATGLKDKMKSKMYRWKPEFKYSTRIVCTYVVGLLCVYKIAIFLLIGGGLAHYLLNGLSKNEEMLKVFDLDTKDVSKAILITLVSWFVALGTASIFCCILVANMLAWYRGHLARLQRGDRGFLPVEIMENSPSFTTVATMKYSGYQVAYIAWGFLIMHFLLFIIFTVLGIQIVQPVIDGTLDSFTWNKIKALWPAIVVPLVLFLCQLLLAKFVFLHDRGASLSLNNRRLFHIVTYFMFYFNIFLGLISCLKRILIGAVIGVMFLARTQKSLVPRDYELKDPGFSAYVGYLYLEHTHSNPVLVTFCHVLTMTVRRARSELSRASHVYTNSGASVGNQRPHLYTANRRIRNRWALFVTLLNNPSLSVYRRSDKFTQKTLSNAFKVLINDFAQGLAIETENEQLEQVENSQTSQL